MSIDTKTIDTIFLRKLKQFAAHGYEFESGHFLHKGTRQDPNAKGTQREAFDAYIKGFEEHHRQGYFEIPTGVGKTILFTAIAKNYTDAVNGEKDGPRTLIVVPTEKLAVQTAKSFAKFMPEIAPTIETDDDSGKEIDWENSNIGLQYGKAKHAHRKPRILITTYQSLNADRHNKIYPPNEYGLVIYDEGHAITADQYGQAVDKFKDAIQLAVTATPEYSEEKTVAARLPHRYFDISIAEAINRGDLSNVRPVLLRTNYSVNKEKFRQYLKKRNGQPLTEAQLTSLLNEQTRNQAAMETYLLGADPDSGERYLGQNGMIFCGTTDHVDDFTRQFNELLNNQTYRPVKKWLNDENVELIAPVHGKIKGALLKKGLLTNKSGQVVTEGRRYEGNKEFYSEEEIFDLHAKGKILLLSSVKKLKEGYDSPRDSIIIDTVDRLSKVDATQIVGRGFRQNPPNAEFNDPGDPDKTCTVINMVDKNTHELYADKPQMLPIYCAEIIEGAEFRTPRKRRHLIQRFSKQPPELNTSLEASGFKLETDMERVREESRTNKKKRDDAKPIEKPMNVWSGADLSLHLGTQTGKHNIKKIMELFKVPETQVIEYYSIPIPREAMVPYNESGHLSYGIKEDVGKKLVQAITSSRQPKNVWSSTDLDKKTNSQMGGQIVKTIATQFADKSRKNIRIYDIEIPKSAVVKFKSVGKVIFGIKAKYGQKIVYAHNQKQDKPDNALSGKEFAKILGITEGSGYDFLREWRHQFLTDKTKKTIEFHGVLIPKDALIEYDSNTGKTIGILKKYAKKAAAAYIKVGHENQDENRWSSVELARAMGIQETNGHQVISAIKKQFANPKNQTATYIDIALPRIALLSYEHNGRPSLGIAKEWGEKIARRYKELIKPDDIQSSVYLGKLLGSSNRGESVLNDLKKQRKNGKSNLEIYNITIPSTALVDYFQGGRIVSGLEEVWCKKIAEAQKGTEITKASSIVSRKSPAHQTPEERAEAKRGETHK